MLTLRRLFPHESDSTAVSDALGSPLIGCEALTLETAVSSSLLL